MIEAIRVRICILALAAAAAPAMAEPVVIEAQSCLDVVEGRLVSPAVIVVEGGTDVATYARDRPGLSAFALEDGVVYHTYSAYARGLDGLWSMYQWLDRAPKGRNEQGVWWRRHDEYGRR